MGAGLLMASGAPTGNALLWNDGRSTKPGRALARGRRHRQASREGKRIGDISGAVQCSAGVAGGARSGTAMAEGRGSVLVLQWLVIPSAYGQAGSADMSDASNPFGDIRERGRMRKRRSAPMVSERYRDDVSSDRFRGHLCRRCVDTRRAPLRISSSGRDTGGHGTVRHRLNGVWRGCRARPGRPASFSAPQSVRRRSRPISIATTAEGDATTIALDDGLYLRAMPTLAGCETLGVDGAHPACRST